MAVIPLSEIPNAPKAPDALVGQSRFPTDQVGGQVSSDISRGYQGAMADPSRAGVVQESQGKIHASDYLASEAQARAWDANALVGATAARATGEIAGAAMEIDASCRRRQEQADRLTAIPKFYKNQQDAQIAYQTKIQGLPESQWASAYVEVYGHDAQAIVNGADGKNPMSLGEQQAMAPEILHSVSSGFQQAAHSAFVADRQDKAADLTTQIAQSLTTAQSPQDYQKVMNLISSGVGTGLIGKQQQIQLTEALAKTSQFNTVLQTGLHDPNGQLAQNVRKAVSDGTVAVGTDGKPIDLAPETLQKAVHTWDAHAVQNESNTMDTLAKHVDAGLIKDPSQLASYPAFNTLSEGAKKAITNYVHNPFLGTQQGALNVKQGQALIDSFPSKSGSDVPKELQATKQWIMGNVPYPFAQDQLKALNKVTQEIADHQGIRPANSTAIQFASKAVDDYMNAGALGKFDKKVFTDPSADHSADDINKATKALAIREQIMKTVRDASPQTTVQAADIVNQEMRRIRQGQNSGHGVIYNLFHSTPKAPQISP